MNMILVVHLTCNQKVLGSSPKDGSNEKQSAGGGVLTRGAFCWHTAEMNISPGQRFAGLIDEVLPVDMALPAAPLGVLHRLPGPAGDLL